MGVSFVGAVMAAIVADTVDKSTSRPSKFVVGMQRPSARSFWKIRTLNKGLSPVKAEDPEVDPMIRRCVLEKKTLVATYVYDVLKCADVVIVGVQLDYSKHALRNVRQGNVETNALEESFEIMGRHVMPHALILIETTVAPGTTEQVALPAIRKIFRHRGIVTDPLLAHSYERVMPRKNYVASIRDFWRVYSGVNDEAKARMVKFLNEVLNTARFPLTVLNFGDLSVLSFHATKVYTTFEGGAIICHDEATKKRTDFLKNFGFAGETTVVASGINAKMNEFQAVLGLLQLKYVDEAIEKRRRVALHYRERLTGPGGITYLDDIPGVRHCYPYFPILVDKNECGRSRDEIYDELKKYNIFCRRYFYPLISRLPPYRGLESAAPARLPVAEAVTEKVFVPADIPGIEF